MSKMNFGTLQVGNTVDVTYLGSRLNCSYTRVVEHLTVSAKGSDSVIFNNGVKVEKYGLRWLSSDTFEQVELKKIY